MKKWPWKKILLVLSCVLIAVGIGPFAYLYWYVNSYLTPLNVPLPTRGGEYIYAFTTPCSGKNCGMATGFGINFKIDFCGIPGYRGYPPPVPLHWQVMDSFGNLVAQDGSSMGRYGNGYTNGEFKAEAGWHLYFFLKVNGDHPDVGALHPRLRIYAADEDYMGIGFVGGFITAMWAIVVAGTGIVLLVGVLLRIWVDHRDKLHEI